MDLRKSVLIKQVLSESSIANVSDLSLAYESAAEDSDTTMFYSFNNDSIKSIDLSNAADEDDNSLNSEADKENTIIQQRQSIQTEKIAFMPINDDHNKAKQEAPDVAAPLISVEAVKESSTEAKFEQESQGITSTAKRLSMLVTASEVHKESDAEKDKIDTEESVENMETVESIVAETEANPQLIDDISPPSNINMSFNYEEDLVMKEANELPVKVETAIPMSVPVNVVPEPETADLEPHGNVLITIDSPMIEDHDPNANIVNPFTAPPVAEALQANVVIKRVTRRPAVTTKIPAKTFLYSPVMRRSIDRKGKPPITRRTILHQENKPGPSRGSGGAKTPTAIPKPVTTKPKTFKCSFAACFNEEFPTLKAYQDHQKNHRSTNIATTKPSFNCKWCDKKFQLENALINHQTESCPKIPPVEKRKILSQSDKREKDRRRTTLFAPPMPKRKSPMRRPVRTDLNRSGIKITPKKSLKCHLCNEVVNDAVSLANHILTHKFNRENA